MSIKWSVLFSILLNIFYANASLLFWSSKSIDLPATKRFTNEDFQELLVKLNNPKVTAFNGNYTPETLLALQKENHIKYTSYVPTSDVIVENMTGKYYIKINEFGTRFSNKINLFRMSIVALYTKVDFE